MLSANGRIGLRRTRYYSPGEGSVTPADRLLDATEAAISVGVRELCCRLGTHATSFDRSADDLKQAAQVALSAETLRGVVEDEGKAVLKASADEQLEIDWSAAACKTRTPEGAEVSRLYVSADGVLLPTVTAAEKLKRRRTVLDKRRKMPRERRRRLAKLRPVKEGTDQRYKQAYVTDFYDQGQDHRLVGVTRKGHKGLGKMLRREAARVLLRGAAERVGLVDGAVCLRTHLEGLPLEVVLLDFYHLAKHVKEAAGQTLGEGAACQAWVTEVLHTVRHEGYEPFFQKLVDWRGGLRGGKRKAADKLLQYVAARQDMIKYAECEERGWSVGTGPVESMCGVLSKRIKGQGRRWDLDNAEAVMALEALRQSGLWDRHWDKVLQCQG